MFHATKITIRIMRWDSSINISMGYGLDGRGSILGRGKVNFFFSTASRLVLRPTQPPI
jgi:hypothetical protein